MNDSTYHVGKYDDLNNSFNSRSNSDIVDTSFLLLSENNNEFENVEELDVDAFAEDNYYQKYTVKEGETVAIIANMFGVNEEDIRRINNMDETQEVIAQDVIYIPMKDMAMGNNESAENAGSSGTGGANSFNNMEDTVISNDDFASDSNSRNVNGAAISDDSLNGNYSEEGLDEESVLNDNGIENINDEVTLSDGVTISPATSDLSNLNLEQLQEIVTLYTDKINRLLEKYGYTKEDFELVINDAIAMCSENEDYLDLDISEIVSDYLYVYYDIDMDTEIIDKILNYLRIINMANDEINPNSSNGVLDNPYESIINSVLSDLGYNVEELSILEKASIIKEKSNEIDLDILLPDDMTIESVMASCIFSYIYSLYPTDENFDEYELLGNYLNFIKELLVKAGYDESEIESKNVFEIANIVNEHVGDVNEVLNSFGLEMSEEFGIEQLLLGPMMSVAYSMIKDNRDMFIQYMEANDYSSEVIEEATASYDKGNITSAIYILQLYDLEPQEEEYRNRLAELEDYFYIHFEEGEDLKELYWNTQNLVHELCDNYNFLSTIPIGGNLSMEVWLNSVINIREEYNNLLIKESLGTLTEEEASLLNQLKTEKYSVLLGNEFDEYIKLFNEKLSIDNWLNDLDKTRKEIKKAIVNSSYEYLENLSETEEYQNIVNDYSGNASDNPAIQELWDINVENRFSSVFLPHYLSMYIDRNSASPFMEIFIPNVEGLLKGNIDEAKIKKVFKYYDMDDMFDEILNVSTVDGNVVISISIVDSNQTFEVIYNEQDGFRYALKDEQGNTIKEIDDLAKFDGINYFKAFKQLEDNPAYAGMTRKEIMNMIYGDESTIIDDEVNRAVTCYKYMEDAEINNYLYIYETEGPEAANRYIEVMMDVVYQRIGAQHAEADIERIMRSGSGLIECLASFNVGVENGVQGWYDNVYTFFSRDTTMTPNEYEQYYLLQTLKSFASPIELDKIRGTLDDEAYQQLCSMTEPTYIDYMYLKGDITEEQYNNLISNSSFTYFKDYARKHLTELNYSYMIGQNVGNMLPSVAVSLMCAPLGSISVAGHTIQLGKAAASIAMFAGAWGGSYKEAVRNGADGWRANLFAFLSAASEVATEYYLGKVPGVARMTESLKPVFGQNIWQALGLAGINLLKDVGGELMEESLQIWIDYALNAALLGKTIDLSEWPSEELDTAIVTIATTLILGLPASATSVGQGFAIKIDENNELNLSFADIVALNQKYVKEDGSIDIAGLQEEIMNRIKGMNIELARMDPIKRQIYSVINKGINSGYYSKETILSYLIAAYNGDYRSIRYSDLQSNVKGVDKGLILEIYNELSGNNEVNNSVNNSTITTANSTTNTGTNIDEDARLNNLHFQKNKKTINRDYNSNPTDSVNIRAKNIYDLAETEGCYMIKHGIRFVSDSKQGLDRLIARYERLISIFGSEYFESTVKGKGLIITNYYGEPGGNDTSFFSSYGEYIYLTDTTLDTTIFHEYTHYLDYMDNRRSHAALRRAIKNFKTNANELESRCRYFVNDYDKISKRVYSNNAAFRNNAIQNLVQNYIDTHPGATRTQALYHISERAIASEIRKLQKEEMDNYEAISDIFDAIYLGHGPVKFPAGHTVDYWSYDTNIYKEILAQVGSIYNSGRVDLLYKYFPKEFADNLINIYKKVVKRNHK